MAPRRPVPEPIKCRATSRRTGERCGQWAIPGSAVCRWHGGLGGRNGRAHTEELHTTRRIESVVTSAVVRQLTGFEPPPELLADLASPPPRVRVQDSDATVDESVIEASMAQMAGTFLDKFAALLVGAKTAPPAPVPAPPEPDPVAEDIARLEARPTARRMAEASRLRRPREHAHDLTPHGQDEPSPAPVPDPVPESSPVELGPGHRTTTLGSRPDGSINTGGHFR